MSKRADLAPLPMEFQVRAQPLGSVSLLITCPAPLALGFADVWAGPITIANLPQPTAQPRVTDVCAEQPITVRSVVHCNVTKLYITPGTA